MRKPRGTPLFHALVIAGAGLSAASCGGKSTGETSSQDGDAAAGGREGSGGRGSGGARSTGGLFNATGGSAAGGLSSLPDDGTLAQWSCFLPDCRYRMVLGGDYRFVHRIDAECPVDPERPRSPDDCGVDEWFDCHPGLWNDEQLIWVSCACSPMADAGCGSCPGSVEETTCEGRRRYCGCAQTVILI